MVHGYALCERSPPFEVSFHASLESLVAGWCDLGVTICWSHRERVEEIGFFESCNQSISCESVPAPRMLGGSQMFRQAKHAISSVQLRSYVSGCCTRSEVCGCAWIVHLLGTHYLCEMAASSGGVHDYRPVLSATQKYASPEAQPWELCLAGTLHMGWHHDLPRVENDDRYVDLRSREVQCALVILVTRFRTLHSSVPTWFCEWYTGAAGVCSWRTIMRVVVLGGAGFIGSHCVDELISKAADALVIDNLSTGLRSSINPSACFSMLDVCEPGLRNAVSDWGRPDAMVVLAAQTSVTRSCTDPLKDARTNILGLINVVELCLQLGVPYILFSSSAAVYGESRRLPISEMDVINPQSPYAVSKLAGELYLKNLAQSAGVTTCIMRFSNVFGPRQRSDGEAGVVSIFADHFARSQRVRVYGDGSQTRDFIYVGDVVAAMMRAIETKSGGLFNISTNTSTSVLDLYRTMGDITGHKVPVDFRPARPGDILHSRLDNRRAIEALDWRPHTDLRSGLERTIASLR